MFLRDGKVSSVAVNMGKADFSPSSVPAEAKSAEMINYPLTIDGKIYSVTCMSVGNPHCVVFENEIDALDLATLGPKFEHCEIFPERINAEFVKVIDKTTLRLRVWERGTGETLSCGTGACAAVAAAVKNGFCEENKNITVKLPGGDLLVKYAENGIVLTGDAEIVYDGEFEY